MLTLPDDLILIVAEPLSDIEKIKFSMSSKILDPLKYKFIYRKKINIEHILTLPYFDNFECIELSRNQNKYPKKVKYVYFDAMTTIIPTLVTHLTFDDGFTYPI